MLQQIEEQCNFIADTATLSNEEFALLRRQGIGASDTSVILGLMSRWRTADDLITQKCAKGYTQEEQEVADKAQVRKGRELEPLILQKAEQTLGSEIHKPHKMYQLKDFPYLTINYDGLIMEEGCTVPVEAKLVTIYGDKYYNWSFSQQHNHMAPPATMYSTASPMEHCLEAMECTGIPDYYYAQVQQQLMGTQADHGYLAALRDKDWTLYTFLIPRDEWLQKQIALEGYKFWERVKRHRR